MFNRQASLPPVEKKQRTNFEVFKLSQSNANLGGKTLRDYQDEISRLKNAKFTARSLDRSMLEAGKSNKIRGRSCHSDSKKQSVV